MMRLVEFAMICPFCDFENIAGVDQCAQCHADLANIHGHEKDWDLEQDLVHRPLEELMVGRYVAVPPDLPVRETVRRLLDSGYHCAFVVADGIISGIFTERDILLKLAHCFSEYADEPISRFMTPQPSTLGRKNPVAFGLNRMMVGGYRHIPIVDDGAPVGVVSIRHVLSYLVENFGEVLAGTSPARPSN